MKTNMPDEILQTFALDWHQLMLKSEKHPPQPFEKLQAKAKQAITELTLKQVLALIGEDEDQKPNSDDFSDWTVCETCEVILDDLTDPPMSCICTRRNQLRAELRQSAERIWKI